MSYPTGNAFDHACGTDCNHYTTQQADHAARCDSSCEIHAGIGWHTPSTGLPSTGV